MLANIKMIIHNIWVQAWFSISLSFILKTTFPSEGIPSLKIRWSYHKNENSYSGKTEYLFWNYPMAVKTMQDEQQPDELFS